MKKFYITFGQIHKHVIDGVVYDKDCFAVIEAKDYDKARSKAFDLFGRKWCWLYESKHKTLNNIFYPRGLIQIP